MDNMPLDAILAMASAELKTEIFAVGQRYGLSIGMLDLALQPVLTHIKDAKNVETIQAMTKMEESAKSAETNAGEEVENG